MQEFLNNYGDLVSGEWLPVIVVGLVFFLVQLALCASFCWRLRGQERAIKWLCRDYQRSGDGRSGVRSLSGRHAWLHWVAASFPADRTQRSGNFSRDDALQELDTRIASQGNYLLLQRMGVMAPLLGVVLTVAGFFWLDVGGENESLESIIGAVTPLVAGVGTGAVLAMINQMLLHVAGRRVESLRTSARTWFDTVVWSRGGRDAQTTGVTAVQTMEQLVKEVLGDIHRLSDTLNRAAQIGGAMSALPDQVRSILERKKVTVESKSPSTPVTAGSGRFVAPIPRAAAATRQAPKV
jgi:hypothetical protein